MNQTNESVPPLPPRRIIWSATMSASDAHLLDSVPPPPSPNNYNDLNFSYSTRPSLPSLPSLPSFPSFQSFPSYPTLSTLSPLASMPTLHSLQSLPSMPSLPSYHNATYTYSMPPLFRNTSTNHASLEDIKKLVNNGNSLRSHNNLVNESINQIINANKIKKANNSDLIDLVDSPEKDKKDVLFLFDPLLVESLQSISDDLNFSNNFTDVFNASDEIDKNHIEEKVILRKKPNLKLNESLNGEDMPSSECAKFNSDMSKPLRVVTKKSRANEEMVNFCSKLQLLRSQFQCSDQSTNAGIVISPTLESQHDKSLSVKLVIDTHLSPQPVSFTCNIDTSVEHIISQVICFMVEDASQENMDDYMLKVFGLSEYFDSHSSLANYSYVHHCYKFSKDVHLSLVNVNILKRPFARNFDDDESINFTADDLLPKNFVCKFGELSTMAINILLETFDKEIEKLRSDARLNNRQLQSQSIIQTVKAICAQLSTIETIAITESWTNFSQLCNAFGEYKRDSNSSSESTTFNENIMNAIPDLDSRLWEILDHALHKLKQSLSHLISMYSNTFPVDFDLSDETNKQNKRRSKKEICSSMDLFLCYIGVCCQLQADWLNKFKEFRIKLELYHGTTKLSTCTSKTVSPTKSFFPRLSFDEWLQFVYPIFNLPREVRLEATLIGIKSLSYSDNISSSPTNSSNATINYQESTQDLAIGILYLFDYRQILVQSQYLMPMWTNTPELSLETDRDLINCMCIEKTSPILHIIFNEMDFDIMFPPVMLDQKSNVAEAATRKRLNSLDSATQTEIFQLLNRNPIEPMSIGECEQLWDRRHYLYDCSDALPKVLLAAHSWEWSALNDIYSMVEQWSPLSPVESMQLLLPTFPDIRIKELTINWLERLTSDELCDFLPQLVQALRFDCYIDSPLIWLLLKRSLSSVRVCHYLFWLLQCNIDDQIFGYRTRIYLNSLLEICGEFCRNMISRQQQLCQDLSNICDHVKSAKESQRLNTLLMELQTINCYLVGNTTILPLSPSMEVCGLDIKSCSYFPSNTLPLKLVFKSPDTKSSDSVLEAIFKVGDDLRQDMLSMQMIKIMDKIWLKAGLDLRMVTFDCLATDYRKGMVQMVPNSETLRKIQSEHGLTGSFKDKPISEWLQKHNTCELDYHKAVDNFTYSCAGYSVATYVLGICDRHNDNIMLTTSGHLFHIDFGKFLGDAQMMAGIKRDRVPFVLTQDMAYVINYGDRPSKQFQFFIEICCQAFNLLRKNMNFLLSLFSLLMSSRISGLNIYAFKHVHNALMPHLSDAEAMSQFTRMIEDSLRSKFTQFNFFIHNLAQLRFTGDHNDQLLLSFVPKKFTKESDGEINHLEVVDCCKKYEPEKVYYYIIKVNRQYQPDPNLIHRTYREFLELHDKLSAMFPLAKFYALPRSSNLIRSNTRDVAHQRRQEINHFINGLVLLAHEISHSDIVYTFFHPILRDQEGATSQRISTLASPAGVIIGHSSHKLNRRESLYGPAICGQVKISVVYKNMSLVIMIMHAKNLQSPRSSTPDFYVKTYLNPDPNKVTKRKTRVINKSCHPSFMEMIVYNGIPLEIVQQKVLQVSVWDYDRVAENIFVGAANIKLNEFDLKIEYCDWFALSGH